MPRQSPRLHTEGNFPLQSVPANCEGNHIARRRNSFSRTKVPQIRHRSRRTSGSRGRYYVCRSHRAGTRDAPVKPYLLLRFLLWLQTGSFCRVLAWACSDPWQDAGPTVPTQTPTCIILGVANLFCAQCLYFITSVICAVVYPHLEPSPSACVASRVLLYMSSPSANTLVFQNNDADSDQEKPGSAVDSDPKKQDNELDLYRVVLDNTDDPKLFPAWRKWVILLIISSAAMCVACASSMVCSPILFLSHLSTTSPSVTSGLVLGNWHPAGVPCNTNCVYSQYLGFC
jgi:hypothetical protein